LLVPEGNICINIYGGNRSSLGSLLTQDSLSPYERSSLLTQDNLCPRERGLTTAAAVVNQHTWTTILFYVKNLST
jgi:hypothetical protein